MARIGNFTKIGLRPAIRGVGKVLGLKPFETERLAKMVPEPEENENPIDLLDRAVADNYEFQYAFNQILGYRRYVEGLVGKIDHRSVHPGGVVISSESQMDVAPIGMDKKSEFPLVQFDHRDVEKIGLVKFDILGLQVLDAIDECIYMVEHRYEVVIDWDEIGLKTYEVYAQCLSR